MITGDDLISEINKIESVAANEKDNYKAAMLKSNVLILKMLHNIRTNQTTDMRFRGVELKKTRKTNE